MRLIFNSNFLKTASQVPDNIVFSESYAAARSLKNIWTRMASTYRCISVCLHRDVLIIRPRWFLGWLIYLLALDLYHDIPIGKIRSIKLTGKWSGFGKVEVSFVTNDSEVRKILLYLKGYDQFINQVKELNHK